MSASMGSWAQRSPLGSGSGRCLDLVESTAELCQAGLSAPISSFLCQGFEFASWPLVSSFLADRRAELAHPSVDQQTQVQAGFGFPSVGNWELCAAACQSDVFAAGGNYLEERHWIQYCAAFQMRTSADFCWSGCPGWWMDKSIRSQAASALEKDLLRSSLWSCALPLFHLEHSCSSLLLSLADAPTASPQPSSLSPFDSPEPTRFPGRVAIQSSPLQLLSDSAESWPPNWIRQDHRRCHFALRHNSPLDSAWLLLFMSSTRHTHSQKAFV